MITCPNCNHQNPEGALQCEACYTPLPEMVACPSCNTPVQADASFCGQCGCDLRAEAEEGAISKPSQGIVSSASSSSRTASGSTEVSAMPDSSMPTQNFLVEPQLGQPAVSAGELYSNPASDPDLELPDLVAPDPLIVPESMGGRTPDESGQSASQPDAGAFIQTASETEPPISSASSAPPMTPPMTPAVTQLQTLSARLRQVQTGSVIEIPRQLSVVRIGKPNDQTPPDMDVSGFPDSEVVSRVHANLRVEGDVYYIEDVGSSNGTYINGLPLAAGNRHRLRPGDRIALGKGDKVSFVFETA